MSKTLTASEQATLLRYASSLPEGHETRRAIVAAVSKVASDFTLYKDYLAWRNEVEVELRAKNDADPEDYHTHPVQNMRMDRYKAESSSEKTFAVLENLYYKDVNSEAKLHAWASRITDPNTAVSLAYTGWKLSKGDLSRWDNSYFVGNWKGYGARFKLFGEQVQKACEARFWEIAGRDSRVKPPASTKPVFEPPSLPTLTSTADAWQLYDQPGAGRAAAALTAATLTILKMVGRNITPYNKDEKNAEAVIALLHRMNKVFRTYSEWGATDGEPVGVFIGILRRYLAKYLDEWQFRKTFQAME